MPAVASPRSIATREVGYASQVGSQGWWGNLQEEQTPELRWPASLDVFDRMRRQDAQVVSVLRAVKLPLQTPVVPQGTSEDPAPQPRSRWRLDPTGCRDEVVLHVARDLGLPVIGRAEQDSRPVRRRGRFSWAEHLRLALLHLDFGHMAFEQQYALDDAGMAHLVKLGPRLPKTIAEFKVARDGGLESIKQHTRAGWVVTDPLRSSQPTIPISRLVMYVNEREGGNWVGVSLLRAAYKNWLIKDDALRVWAQTVDRNGLGVPTYTGAENEDDLTAGLAIAQGYRSGANSGAAVPYTARLDLKGVDGDLPDGEKLVRYHDEQIARAVLAHFLNLGTQTGSWALGSTFADFFTMSLNAVGQTVADTSTAHVVEDIVDTNWGPDEPAPAIVFEPITPRDPAIKDSVAATTRAVGGDEGVDAVMDQVDTDDSRRSTTP